MRCTNPLPGAAPLTVELTLAAEGFPPNLDELAIGQVLVAVARTPQVPFEIGPIGLTPTPADGAAAVGGVVDSTVDGLVSTRRGNASPWIPLLGRSPAGTWRLTCPTPRRCAAGSTARRSTTSC